MKLFPNFTHHHLITHINRNHHNNDNNNNNKNKTLTQDDFFCFIPKAKYEFSCSSCATFNFCSYHILKS